MKEIFRAFFYFGIPLGLFIFLSWFYPSQIDHPQMTLRHLHWACPAIYYEVPEGHFSEKAEQLSIAKPIHEGGEVGLCLTSHSYLKLQSLP